MHALRQFMSFIRRECGVRDGYTKLEKYLENAPLEVMREVEMLTQKLEDLKARHERRGRNKAMGMF